MKLKKRIFAIFTVMIMAVSIFTIPASALGAITRTSSQGSTSTKFNITYSFNVDGNKLNNGFVSEGYGTRSNKGFYVSSSKNYTFSFNGANNAGATVYIYREGYSNYSGAISIPQKVNGMPTMTSSVYLSEGFYYVRIVSKSNTVYSIGSITAKDVAGIATITF